MRNRTRSISVVASWLLVVFLSSTGVFAEVFPPSMSVAVDATVSASEISNLSFDKLTLATFLEIGGFVIQGQAAFSGGGFDSLDFKASGKIGEIGLGSSLAFDPMKASFESWQSVVELSVLDVDVTDILYLTQTGSYNQVDVKGEADGVAWDVATKFEMWCWCFLEAKLEASWEWVECGISMSTSTYYTKDIGFGYFALSMKGIALFQEEDVSIQPLVDLEFRFTTDTKVLTPTLRLEATQWWGCPECYVLGELVWTGAPFSMAGLSVYGMVCQLEFDNEVTATLADSFIDAKNSAVTGFAEFFELWQFAGPLVPYCGSPGSWEVSVYFLNHPVPTPLFGWGMTSFTLDTSLSEQVGLSLAIEFRPGSPHWKFELGLKTLW